MSVSLYVLKFPYLLSFLHRLINPSPLKIKITLYKSIFKYTKLQILTDTNRWQTVLRTFELSTETFGHIRPRMYGEWWQVTRRRWDTRNDTKLVCRERVESLKRERQGVRILRDGRTERGQKYGKYGKRRVHSGGVIPVEVGRTEGLWAVGEGYEGDKEHRD